jgi:hypothetical protein
MSPWHPRFVVASAGSSPSDEPSTGAEARFLFRGLDAALKRRSSTVVRGFVAIAEPFLGELHSISSVGCGRTEVAASWVWWGRPQGLKPVFFRGLDAALKRRSSTVLLGLVVSSINLDRRLRLRDRGHESQLRSLTLARPWKSGPFRAAFRAKKYRL